MPSDASFAQTMGWTLWYIGELAFRWIPGIALSIFGVHEAGTPPPPPIPTFLEPLRVETMVQFVQDTAAPGVYEKLYQYWFTFVGVSVGLSLIFAAVLIYSIVRVFQIRRMEYRRFQAASETIKAHDDHKTRLRWDHIMEQARSDSDQGRRLAILEADIMLNELLDELGYRGETIADKMRQVPRAQFNTIDYAWEAHRARNSIAHQAGFAISASEVERIIGLYDRVFKEFGFSR